MPQSLEKRGMRRWGALAWSAALVAGLLLQGAALAQETRSGQTVALKIPKCASPAKRIMIGTVSCRAAACNAPGTRNALTSLIKPAPARTAARMTSGREVSIETGTSKVLQSASITGTTRLHSSSTLG